jgi:hypothetical protein
MFLPHILRSCHKEKSHRNRVLIWQPDFSRIAIILIPFIMYDFTVAIGIYSIVGGAVRIRRQASGNLGLYQGVFFIHAGSHNTEYLGLLLMQAAYLPSGDM